MVNSVSAKYYKKKQRKASRKSSRKALESNKKKKWKYG